MGKTLFWNFAPPLLGAAALALMVSIIVRAADGITVIHYDGWRHRCEAAGGVAHDGVCFDPSALVTPAE